MNKILHSAVVFLLIAVLVCSLAACGQRAAQPEPVTETKEIVVETPPPSPTPIRGRRPEPCYPAQPRSTPLSQLSTLNS